LVVLLLGGTNELLPNGSEAQIGVAYEVNPPGEAAFTPTKTKLAPQSMKNPSWDVVSLPP
jgi:hypothetical protein